MQIDLSKFIGNRMSPKQKADAFDVMVLIERFNKNYPVGSKVMHRTTNIKSYPFVERVVKLPAYTNNLNSAFAVFEGLEGGYDIEEGFVKYEDF